MGEDQAQQYSQYYGTFQGVANHWPPHQQPYPGFPQPIPPPFTVAAHPAAYYNNGYQHIATGYAPVEEIPVIIRAQHRLPCCGLGMGWILFGVGFFLGGIPWYVATFLLLFSRLDVREKPGYIACAVASALAAVTMTFGITAGGHHRHWWSLTNYKFEQETWDGATRGWSTPLN